jgi:SAM-dependent MidA family methyltransferase
MTDALYGDAGFYRSPAAPARHFRTAAHVGSTRGGAWANALERLTERVDEALGEPAEMTVVDVGAGGGELLAGLAERLPPRIRLVGVDVAPRPAGLAEQVEWADHVPQSVVGVLLAVEWLDVVPLDIAELDDAGTARLVEVGRSGEERLGLPLQGADLAWQQRWWPLHEAGDRAEIGHTRDDAWHEATDHLGAGLAVAVDYAAAPARDAGGTLTGFQDGRQCLPVPDGSCDITAHVLFESLVRSGDVLLDQRAALQQLGVAAPRPAYAGDPQAYLTQLAATGDAAELLDPGGLGGFTWLLHPAGIESPLT